MPKFNPGDKIKGTSGLTGTIAGVSGSIKNGTYECEYSIEWDQMPGKCSYTASDVDNLWSKLADSAGYFSLPESIYSLPFDYVSSQTKPDCEHKKWVNVSLNRVKMVCFDCGIDKP